MKQVIKLVPLLVGAVLLMACSDDNDEQAKPSADWSKTNQWFELGQNSVQAADEVSEQLTRGSAKNVILFVGDGFGVSTLTATRILAGQREGLSGEEYQLSFDRFPVAGLLKTYNTNQQTPDSAGTMTAMMSGVKTKSGVIGYSQEALRADCASGQGRELVTALELAEMSGKATGVVSTARITHATPAATYAKSVERNWESDDKLSDEAKVNGCKDIARQLVEFAYGDGIDVVLGGGRRHFIPNTLVDEEGKSGKRRDGANLIDEWQNRYPTGRYVFSQSGFDSIDPATTDKVLGLFNSSHMQYEADRLNDVAGEPSLSDMTQKAVDILSRNEQGFFLTVEAGRIDHGHHAGNAYRALSDALEFHKAVQVAMDSVDLSETLIIVTADHSHVMTMAGYPTRGNPILGLVTGNDSAGLALDTPTLARDERPYTTLGYTNGLGYANYGDESYGDQRYADPHATGRHLHPDEDTENKGFHQESLIPLGSETHAGEDVSVHAIGPGAQLLRGVNEQSTVFHVMEYAADLINQAEAATKQY